MFSKTRSGETSREKFRMVRAVLPDTPIPPPPISTQITMFPLFTVFTFFYRGVGWGGWGVAKKMPVKHNKKTAPATTTVSLGEPLSEAPARTWRLSHSIYP